MRLLRFKTIFNGCINVKEIDNENTFQYTGYLDINGEYLYEGNIVRRPNGGLGIVKFGRYGMGNTHIGFYIEWLDDEYVRNDLGYWLNKIEIIGNIVENKELLEVKKC